MESVPNQVLMLFRKSVAKHLFHSSNLKLPFIHLQRTMPKIVVDYDLKMMINASVGGLRLK
jgi:hypothetical protein